MKAKDVLQNDVVCFDCGVKYLTDKQKQSGGNAVTFHQGECCVCGQDKSVTSIRHYNNLIPSGEALEKI